MKPKYWKSKIISLITITSFSIISNKLIIENIPSVGAIVEQTAIASAQLNLPNDNNFMTYVATDSQESNSLSTDTTTEINNQPEVQQVNNSNEQPKTNNDEPPIANFSEEELNQFPDNNGPIIRKHYEAGSTEQYVNIGNSAFVRNMTKLPNQVIIDANNSKPAFTLTKGSEPQVLIYHTHTTESYELQEKDYYAANFPIRSRNTNTSVVRVGDEITKCLEQAGIGVIHDTTVHDDPAYKGSYDRSHQTIRQALEKYPSIKVALDIHRDAIANDKGERYAPIANINGRNASQIMIISGCDNGTMNYPNYTQNLAFACLLQRQLETDYPSLTRPASFKYKYYNQSLTPGTLLVEFGGHANSVNEAIYAGWLFGKSLANALATIQN